MKFKLYEDGNFHLVNHKSSSVLNENQLISPNPMFIIDTLKIKESIKSLNFLKSKYFSLAPIGFVLGTTTGMGGTGIFWDTFLKYIFPYMIDIAKVFCIIKIAQGFYEEKRGGRDGGSGIGTLVTYGKWLILFYLIPFGVELIGQLGEKMFNDLKTNPIIDG